MFIGYCFDFVTGLSTCSLVGMFNLFCVSTLWTFESVYVSNMFQLGLGPSVLIVVHGAMAE